MSAPYRWVALATYNAERSRGVTHTPEWDERMAQEQAAFNAAQRQRMVDEGWEPMPGHPGVWMSREGRTGTPVTVVRRPLAWFRKHFGG